MRKIIQICAVPSAQDNHMCTTVLCNDGTVWTMAHIHERAGKWTPLPAIPQPKTLTDRFK